MTTTPADVAVELNRPTPADQSVQWKQWAQWIDQTRMLIGDRLGDLAALNQVKLDYVVLMVVASRARRPDDATTVETAVDDGRTTRTYSSSSGQLLIKDEWWRLLTPPASTSGAFTVTPAWTPDRPTRLHDWPAVYR